VSETPDPDFLKSPVRFGSLVSGLLGNRISHIWLLTNNWILVAGFTAFSLNVRAAVLNFLQV